MDSKKLDLEGLSDPSMEGVDVSGLTVDDILAEARGEPVRAAEPPARDRAAEPKPVREPEPVPVPEPVYGSESAPEPEPDYEPEPEPVYEPENVEDGFEEELEDWPEDGEDADEREPRRRLPISFSGGFLGLLALMILSLAVLGAAVVPDLPDPAWSILVIAALVIACVPLVLEGLKNVGAGRIPAPFIMLASVLIYALTARLVEATVAAVVFNVCSVMFRSYSEGRLDLISDRLGRNEEPEDPRATLRRMSCVRGVIGGQIEPMSEQRRLEGLTALGALVLAVFFSVIPPLLDGMDFLKWIARGAVVLSLCAYYGEAGAIIAYLNAVERSFSGGVCFSGAEVMADAARTTSVIFNKTGTLTDGSYAVKSVDPVRISEEQLLYLASYAGAYSNHALIRAIREYAGFEPDTGRVLRHRVQPGYGSMVLLEGNQIVGVGNIDFMEKLGIKGELYMGGDTCVFVSVGRTCVGRIDFIDRLSEGAQSVATALRRERVANIALMTGDNALSATNVGKSVNISEIYSDCRPKEKADRLRYILQSQEDDDRLMVVSRAGEDSELLKMANIGVTLGIGLDATDEFPDVVIPSGGLMKLPALIGAARKASRSITVSSAAFIAARLLSAILAVAGVLPLWIAVLIMSAVQLGTFMSSDSAAR